MDEELLNDGLIDDDEYIDLLIEGVEAEAALDECQSDDEMNILNEMGF